jgi:hypothetical protein
MRSQYWSLIIFSFVACNLAQAAGEIVSTFDNQYTAKLLGLNIVVTSRLKATGTNGNYELYLNADAFAGSITETSKFQWNAKEQLVIPIIYTSKMSGFGTSSEEQLNFNWTKLTINDIKNNTSLPMSATKRIQDSLSYQLQLRQDLIAGKKSFIYSIGDSKKIKEISFSRYTYAWFAKNYQYLLVRLQQENKGIAYTMDISKASLNGKSIEKF